MDAKYLGRTYNYFPVSRSSIIELPIKDACPRLPPDSRRPRRPCGCSVLPSAPLSSAEGLIRPLLPSFPPQPPSTQTAFPIALCRSRTHFVGIGRPFEVFGGHIDDG